MGEIYVKTEELRNKIADLKVLRSRCAALNMAVQPFSGGGKPIEILRCMDEKYFAIRSAMTTLIDRTVVFLEDAVNRIEETDRTAAQEMRQGEAHS